jgi:NADH:ubiquinone oxidoreductase subunit 6 (subunit J)
MTLFAAAGTPSAASLAIAMVLGALGLFWLLPRPQGRSVALGSFALLAAAIVLAVWFINRFGRPAPDLPGTILFALFSAGAVGFSAVFVTQRNPARGAIAFAFVIVSVCGLFLLLAAPFLMAATIIIYAGAIIVTFLFVLMLSQTRIASDENDRTREPLLGSLGAFSFLGLVLFALYLSSPAAVNEGSRPFALPAQPMLPGDRVALAEIATQLRVASAGATRDEVLKPLDGVASRMTAIVGGKEAAASAGPGTPDRLQFNHDLETASIRRQADAIREAAPKVLKAAEDRLITATPKPDAFTKTKAELAKLADDVALLSTQGDLPARNIANLGYVMYSDYLLGVEMAGAALLIATIGAVLIAGRRESVAKIAEVPA